MSVLIISALTIGSLHALAPDHWLPFAILGKAQKWSKWKTTTVVFLSGVGHVGSSVIIAFIGLLLGAALENVNNWESIRGDVASMLLIGFGIAYTVWGIKQWGKHHTHTHDKTKTVSYWTLFILIVFGPCETLIPLIFASVPFGWYTVVMVFFVFGLATVVMMLLQVHLALFGLSFFHSHKLEHASHVLAGSVIALTGVAIRFFGI